MSLNPLEPPVPPNTSRLLWSNADLIICHPHPTVENWLHYYHRSLEKPAPHLAAEVVSERVDLFRVLSQNPRVIVTYQGYLDKVVELTQKAGMQIQFADRRVPFPNPLIAQARGFRHSQFEMFVRMLQPCRSGLLKAPTRWGKTALLANTCAVFPHVPTVITAPGASLLDQLVKDLRSWLPQRDIRGVFSGSKDRKPSDDISVVSMDSLHKVDAAATRLLLIDEPHALPAASRLAKIMAFTQARIYGFGATLTGRFDHADKVMFGVVGPVLAEKSFKEAVAEGAICNIKVFILEMPVPEHFASITDRLAAYRRLIYQSEEFNQTVRRISTQAIPADWQTLVFVDEIKQADLVQLMVDNGTIAVASRMSPAERRQTMADMAGNIIKRCIATDIYAQGVTFPDLRVIVNAAGGGGSTTSTQKPGRLAQIRPGKTCGYMVDFAFQASYDRCGKGVAAVVRDCVAREKVYRENGYEVVRVKRVDEIKLV